MIGVDDFARTPSVAEKERCSAGHADATDPLEPYATAKVLSSCPDHHGTAAVTPCKLERHRPGSGSDS